MSTSYYQYQPTSSVPLPVPASKSAQQPYPYAPRHNRNSSGHSQLSTSPPERPESVTTSGGTYSAASSSYAGSSSEYDTPSTGATSVDLLDYMSDRLATSYNPLPLDRSMAKQAQSSGELNAKTRELLELQALARRRLAATRANFADGMKAAKEVQRDLQYTQQRVTALNQRAAQKYPQQYRVASDRYPKPVDF